MSSPEAVVRPESRRPPESRFKQQTLPAWRPQIVAGTVSPLFFVIGSLLVPVGLGILLLSEKSRELVLEYTQCIDLSSGSNGTCAEVIGSNRNITCHCKVNFTLEDDLKKQVFMYYRLTNYYQNHRMYAKSRDDVQLLGQLSNEVSPECYPFDYVNESGVLKPIAPCGTIANTLFSDEVILIRNSDEGKENTVPVLRKGIAWPSDKKIKFRNPPGDLKKAFEGFAKPKDWKKHVWELDPEDPENNGFENEDLIVWMRTAALPDFRKLHRLVNHTDEMFKNGLPKGNYTLKITYMYPVAVFGGTKSIIISTMSPMGGDNTFFGVLTFGVGCVVLISAAILQLLHLKFGKRWLRTVIPSQE